MRKIIKLLLYALYKLGIIKLIQAWRNYNLEYKLFLKMRNDNDFLVQRNYPVFVDKYTNSGITEGAYFHQDLLVARRIFENNPNLHVDIGSRVDGFVAHVASFRHITVLDIRPLENKIKNISFLQMDIMEPLKNELIESCDSISCLHALEHFGLGRYGDQINYNGYIVGLENIYKMLKFNGKLYLSVPIGLPQRIEFHAHRIFSIKFLLDQFQENYFVENFSLVDDYGKLHENISLCQKDIDENYRINGNGVNGVGIFEMRKIK